MENLTPIGEVFYRLYENGEMSLNGIGVGVFKGMITAEEYLIITGQEYVPLQSEYPYGLTQTQLEEVEQKYRDKLVSEVSANVSQ